MKLKFNIKDKEAPLKTFNVNLLLMDELEGT